MTKDKQGPHQGRRKEPLTEEKSKIVAKVLPHIREGFNRERIISPIRVRKNRKV